MRILNTKRTDNKPGYAMVIGLLIASVTAVSTAGLFSLSNNSNKRLQPKIGIEQLRQDVRAAVEIVIKDLTTDDNFSTVDSDYWNDDSLFTKLDKLTTSLGTSTVFSDICGPAMGTTFEDRFTDSDIVDNDHNLCDTNTTLDIDKNTAPRLVGTWETNGHRLATFVSLIKPGDDCPSPRNVTYLIATCGYTGPRSSDPDDASLGVTNVALEIVEISRRVGVWNLVTWERR